MQELVDLCEGGGCLQGLEDFAGLLEDGVCLARSAGEGEAAALAEEGEPLLGNNPERLPAPSGVRVPLRRGPEVAVGLGEGGAHRHQSVLGAGRLWLDPGYEPLRELRVTEREGGAHPGGKVGGVVGAPACFGRCLAVGEQGSCSFILSERRPNEGG